MEADPVVALKKLITDYVANVQGCKAINIVAVPEISVFASKYGLRLLLVLNALIDEGSLIEIEYTIPAIPERVKSFILPGRSEVLSMVDDGEIAAIQLDNDLLHDEIEQLHIDIGKGPIEAIKGLRIDLSNLKEEKQACMARIDSLREELREALAKIAYMEENWSVGTGRDQGVP